LPLDDEEQNASFTLMQRGSDRRCVRSSERIFTGTVLGVDEWEALSKDRNDYSISVLYRTGRDHHHITDLPGAVGDKQKAIAQGWQQEQSGRLSDQVSR
jgi:hypothetical protein